MSATPRTVRAVTVPSSHLVGVRPRLRRVTGVHTRPFGAISLFLAATGILGLTSLGYLWQSGQAISAGLYIHKLDVQFESLQNTTQLLQSQVDQLQSPSVVRQAAYTKYGMRNVTDPGAVRPVSVPGPTVTRIVVVPVPAPAHRPGASLRLASTDATVTSWWQDAWVALYRLLR